MTDSEHRIIEKLSEASSLCMDPIKKRMVWADLEQQIDQGVDATDGEKRALFGGHSRRRKVSGPLVAAMVALVVVAAGLSVGLHRLKVVHKQQTVVAKTSYPLFTPPKGMIESYSEITSDGHLRVIGYIRTADSGNPTYAQDLYVVTNSHGSTPEVLYHAQDTSSYFQSDETLWFSPAANTYYLAVGRASEGVITVQRFSTTKTGKWDVAQVVQHAIPGGYGLTDKLDGQHLLFESMAVGIQPPVEYTFAKDGVHASSVTQQVPLQGEISNSVTKTFYVSGTTMNGKTSYKVSGDTSPLYLHVGQHVVIQVVYNTPSHLPLQFLFYGDEGDPGPGSLANRDPSPYTRAAVYTVVNTANYGYIMVVPQILPGMNVGNATSLTQNLIKIPTVVLPNDPLLNTTLALPNGQNVSPQPNPTVNWKDLKLSLLVTSLPPAYAGAKDYAGVIGNHANIFGHESVTTPAGSATLVHFQRTEPATAQSNAVTDEYDVIFFGSQYAYVLNAVVKGDTTQAKSEIMQLLNDWRIPS